MEIRFTETVLRDANQSQIATRLPISAFEEILPTLDRAGYYSLECWGGATFDSCLRYLSEDPWERLRCIRKACPHTKLQMLLRGQNLLGYHHYPDDVVRLFVRKSVDNGMDIIRIFDALNDLRNIRVAMDETVKCGATPSAAICYTTSPVHTLESFAKLSKEMEEMGAQSIAIKDMAGIMGPQECYDLVKAIKETVKVPVVVHTHGTTGLGSMTLLKAAEAGADVIDTALSSFSNGTSQPPTETMAYALRQEGFTVDLDDKAVKEANDFFKKVRGQFLASGGLNPLVLTTNTDALVYQVPGGMLSNLIAQLSAQNAMDNFDAVLAEVPRVRKDLGYPPLVTPMSQMVGVQATMNVLTGERYKMIPKEIKAYFAGEYGKAPGPVDPAVAAKALDGETPITCRYADTLQPGLEPARKEIGALAKSDEDLLSYIAFPQVARAFLEAREANGGVVPAYVPPAPAQAPKAAVSPAPKGEPVASPVKGRVAALYASAGQAVRAGQVVALLEAMGAQTELTAPKSGTAAAAGVKVNDFVDAGQALLFIE